MDRLLNILTWIQILGGIVFFTALFVAPLVLSVKILAAVALMFVSCAVFALMAALTSIEGLRMGVPPAKRGSRLGYLLLAMFAVWIVFGWMLRTFFQV
jgi:hypothetical protein